MIKEIRNDRNEPHWSKSLQILPGFPHADELSDVGGLAFGVDAGSVGFDGFRGVAKFLGNLTTGFAGADGFEDSPFRWGDSVEEPFQFSLRELFRLFGSLNRGDDFLGG